MDVSIPMALVDFVPVIFFANAAIILAERPVSSYAKRIICAYGLRTDRYYCSRCIESFV